MKNLLLLLPVILLLSGLKSDNSPCFYSHQLSQGYQTLYPPKDKLFYSKIEIPAQTRDSTRITFLFVNTFNDFKHYEFRQDERSPFQTGEGKFTVNFDKNATDDIRSTLKIKIFSHDNKVREFIMHLSFDPKTVQERSGRPGDKDGFFIHQSEVGFLEIPFDDFMPAPPPDEEKTFLQNQFGSRIKKTSSEKEKIRILAEDVINFLEPYRGIPSSDMDTLSAVSQLMELKLHNKKVYCGNIAEIFFSTCLSFDIPVRKIGLGNTYDDSNNPAIFHSDYHTTLEVFDKDAKAWYLIDLSFYMLEVKMQNGKPMNFIDFWYLLNSPGERDKMIISEYDVKQKKILVSKISQSKKFSNLMDYYKQNQKFCFAHKNGYFSY